MLIVLTSLGVAVFILTGEKETSPAMEQADEAEYIYVTGSINDVRYVTIRNGHGEYTVRGGEIPSIAGYDDLPISIFYFLNILDVSSRLTSYGLVTDEAADLSVFGLDPAQAQLIIQSDSGIVTILLIGYNAPDGNMYVKLDESPEVFLASYFDVSIFLGSLFSLVDTSLTPFAQMDKDETIVFDKIVLGGSVREAITIMNTVKSDSNIGFGLISPFEVTSPVNAAVSMDNIAMLESMFGLYADRFVANISGNSNTRSDELSRYGLSQPWSTLDLTAAGFNYRLVFSEPDGSGKVFIHREGTTYIYEGRVVNFPWFEIGHFDLMNKIVILPYIDNIASIDIKTPQRTVTFLLTGENEKLAVRAAGIDIDTGNFRTFYQNLIGARYDEYNEYSAGEQHLPFLEIVYNYRDRNKNADTVSFYQATARRVLTSLNGGRAHFTLSAYTDKILSDLDIILSGERIRPYL